MADIVVIRPQRMAGFFANFNKVVSALHHEVEEGTFDSAFVDWILPVPISHFSFGTSVDGNIWERLFFPVGPAPSSGDYVEVVGGFGRGHGMPTAILAYDMYKTGPRWRRRYGSAVEKHVKVRPEIVATVDQIMLPATGPRIGVHYRHPGHNHECPMPIPQVSTFIRQVRKLAGRRPMTVVLATDVESVVTEFRSAFGANLIVQEGVRRSDTSTQWHEREGAGSLDDGRAVLVDALMLARCDVLVHVTSNIATAVGYLNPTLKMVYCESVGDAWMSWVKRQIKPLVRQTPSPQSECRYSGTSFSVSGDRPSPDILAFADCVRGCVHHGNA